VSTLSPRSLGRAERLSIVAIVAAVSVAVVLALAGSQGGQVVWGVPVFALCVALAFAIQWIAFVPANRYQTERYFDLTGSLSFLVVAAVAVLLSPVRDERSLLLLLLIGVWAVRLGGFLFRRMLQVGKDDRFDVLKPSPLRFLAVWTVQGLWVSLTSAAALAAITTEQREPLGLLAALGALVWIVGLAIEVVADRQKRRFRADPANRERFIASGLWAWSRHPNYFGEILLWAGVAIVAVPVLAGAQWLTLLSPVFVWLLLSRISGVPMLERKADERWGGEPDYEAYKARTPALLPRPPRDRGAVEGQERATRT
jgi:steroid 5-alpha reductase family enzyme